MSQPSNQRLREQINLLGTFLSTIIDNAQMSLRKADMTITALYATLTNEETRAAIFTPIRQRDRGRPAQHRMRAAHMHTNSMPAI